jgi:death-on-curing protein
MHDASFTESPDGFRITALRPHLADSNDNLGAAEAIMKRRRHVLREPLAKRAGEMNGFARWLDNDAQCSPLHGRPVSPSTAGLHGVRDAGLLESALSPSAQTCWPTECPRCLADCAAAYGFGIARNHPFVDGNKRAAFVAAQAYFSAFNGYRTNGTPTCHAPRKSCCNLSPPEKSTKPPSAAWLRAHIAAG